MLVVSRYRVTDDEAVEFGGRAREALEEKYLRANRHRDRGNRHDLAPEVWKRHNTEGVG